MAKVLIVGGLAAAGVGALMALGLPLFRLPGDILVRRGAFTFYAPITTSIILSVLLSLALAWFRR